MRIVQAIVVVAALGGLSSTALAFERCDKLLATPAALRAFLVDNGVYKAPVKYFDHTRSIRIETGDRPGGLIPNAGHDRKGQPIIFFPAAFPPTLCRIVLATYMEIEGEWKPFAEASRNAGRCVDSGRPLDICLVEYGRDLERRYRDSFKALQKNMRGVAYAIYMDAAAEIGMHEFAHHVLKHFARIKSGDIARIDAEFEADFYAMQNGVQTRKVASAMFYFYKALADVESYSKTLRTPDYESGACRATNVNDIAAVFGVAPLVVLDTVAGGRDFLRRNSPDLLRKTAEKLRRKAPPKPSADSCGRLSGAVLREAYGELARLTSLVAEYGDVLFAKDTSSSKALALSTPRVYELIDRLQSASERVTHLKGLTAKALSLLIQRVGFAGVSHASARQLDRVLETSTNDIISEDYGRLLKGKGLNALYLSRERPVETRMAEAAPIFEKSVTFGPKLAESWMNLAMITFANGRCGDAAKLAEKARRTSSVGRARGMAKGFRDLMRRFSAEGNCAEKGKSFAESFTR